MRTPRRRFLARDCSAILTRSTAQSVGVLTEQSGKQSVGPISVPSQHDIALIATRSQVLTRKVLPSLTAAIRTGAQLTNECSTCSASAQRVAEEDWRQYPITGISILPFWKTFHRCLSQLHRFPARCRTIFRTSSGKLSGVLRLERYGQHLRFFVPFWRRHLTQMDIPEAMTHH